MPPSLRRGGPPRLLRPPARSLETPQDRQSLPPNVYERERTVTESTLKPQGPRLARDRLLDFMSDSRFHSAHELNHLEGLMPGDFYVLFRELNDYSFTFARRGNSFVMRKRGATEEPLDLVDLFAGLDATSPEDMNRLHAHEQATAVIRHRQGIGPVPLPTHDDSAFERGYGETPSQEEVPSDSPGFEVEADVVPAPPENDRLVLSPECVLPARSTVTSTKAILAKKSSGKSYLAMVMAEEFLRAPFNMPFVAIDPTGVWYGLRSLANEDPSPYKVFTLGGQHGEFSLNRDQGAAVASLVSDLWPQSWVLDVSDMLPEEQHEFVADFGTKLYAVNRKALHLFVDEADEFMPQTTDSSSYRHQRRCLNVMDRIVRRGRVKGLGATLITQRSAVINKNVLSQVDGLFVLAMSAPHDLEAVESWMKPVVPAASERNSCLSALPTLMRGEAFYMSNAASRVAPLVRFMVKPKETFDSSRTPSVDEPEPIPPRLSHPDRDLVMSVGRRLGVVSDDDLEEVAPEQVESDDGNEA